MVEATSFHFIMYFAIQFIEIFLSHLRFLWIDSANKCSELSIKIVSEN
jgi:hypothetical protein